MRPGTARRHGALQDVSKKDVDKEEVRPAARPQAALSQLAPQQEKPPPPWAPNSVVTSVADALTRLRGHESGIIGLTSALRGEGRTTLALATAIAERYDRGRRAVVVDLDLHRPTLEERAHVPPGPGLAEYLRGEANLQECIRWYDRLLGVLPAGRIGDDADALISAALRQQLLQTVAELSDAVVVDLPPLPPTGPGARLAAECRTVLLVVRSGATSADVVRRAVRTLATPPPVILNRMER